jgi:hypothetical protein
MNEGLTQFLGSAVWLAGHIFGEKTSQVERFHRAVANADVDGSAG